MQSFFGKRYLISKEIIKKHNGNLWLRPPGKYRHIFELEHDMNVIDRKKGIMDLFSDYIMILSKYFLTKRGLRKMVNKKILTITPAVIEELFTNSIKRSIFNFWRFWK